NHHYGVFMHGATPLTARLYKPVLVDAQTGELTDTRDLPWYVTALLVSQPLHFGDYGGLPLKILWALLDVATIVVLISGLYLWIARRKSAIEERIEALALQAEELA
ncbi:MAG: PepSY domain-containing protein, partial [Bryobacteraceae bacterium]|nr:PepSY domain-containing protein [Bryobacteraceae bacterium]